MTDILPCPPLSQRFEPAPDLAAVKARQHVMWSSGDFAVIGTTLQIVGESLCEAADLRAGSVVLDVACGNGNAALAAARRFCAVTGVDYVPALIARAADRARAEGLAPTFLEGDAECLPFPDATFDVALSTFGVMFAADQRRAAAELVRVAVPGGKIALASWTPEGFLGEFLRAVARYTKPVPGMPSPLRWGTALGLAELFGDRAAVVHSVRKDFVFRYESASHFIDVFRRFYGPTYKAFESIDEAQRVALANDIERLLAVHDRGGGKGIAVAGEYLETVLETRAAK